MDIRLALMAALLPLTACAGYSDAPAEPAPPPADAFESAACGQPVADAADLVIEYGDRPVALAEAAVLAVVTDGRVHVQVSHPQFAVMPEDDQGQVAFLFLDAVLGEQVVEEAVGEVTWNEVRADGAIPLSGLPAVVAGLRGA